MSDNKEEILANFQIITAIEDVGEALMHLEECNWDLNAAIHRVLPQDNVVQPHFAAATAASFHSQLHEHDLNDLDGVPGSLMAETLASSVGFRNIYGPDLSNSNHAHGAAHLLDLIDEYSRGSGAPASSGAANATAAAGTSSTTTTTNNTTNHSNHSNNTASAKPRLTASSSSSSSSSTASFAVPAALRPSADAPAVGTRVSRIKDVIFNIHHKYTVHSICISNQATVGELKTRIASATQVPACRQALTGWLPNDQPYTSSTVLRTLNIALENNLILVDTSEEGYVDGGAVDDALRRPRQLETFAVLIRLLPGDDEMTLNFPGTQTLQQIKNDVYTITDIPVRHQEWTGWPVGMTNETTLATAVGVGLSHAVTLRSVASNAAGGLAAGAAASSSSAAVTGSRSTTSNGRNTAANASSVGTSSGGSSAAAMRRSSSVNSNVIEIDSDESEFEDATDADFNGDEDMFSEPVVRSRLNHLIIDNVDDEKIGSLQFVENYVQRYGSPHPEFFIGSLEEAMLEACQKPARSRKLLAIYLHDDRSVLTNVFCDQLLKCDSIMQTLQHNFVLYGWDLTHESNKHLFMSALSCVGVTATMTVRSLAISQLPTILIVGKSRSTHEVLSIIHGNVSRDELLNKLIDTMNMYAEARDVEVREENERAAREAVKMEQDEAYEESLEADRRKEETKRQREHEEATERQRADAERVETAALREAARLTAEQAVPAEPAVGAPGCTKIRVRQPNGQHFERRFDGQSRLQHLLSFVASKGFPMDEFKVISSYPRRDLTTLDANDTLSYYKLCPQETVILEER